MAPVQLVCSRIVLTEGLDLVDDYFFVESWFEVGDEVRGDRSSGRRGAGRELPGHRQRAALKDQEFTGEPGGGYAVPWGGWRRTSQQDFSQVRRQRCPACFQDQSRQ
jgi:hypothetical protein